MDNSWYSQYAQPLILAISGGLADFLMGEDHSWSDMFIALFLAGFTGYLVALGCKDYGISSDITCICAGIAGLSSRSLLMIAKRFSIFKTIYMLEQPTDADKPEKKNQKNKNGG